MKIILLICLVFVACKATPNNDIVKYKVHCLKTNSLKEIELRGKNICLSPFNKGETITVNDSGFVCSDTTKNKYVVIYQVK